MYFFLSNKPLEISYLQELKPIQLKKTRLEDGTEVFCIKSSEAKVLDYHVKGYLQHGIAIKPGAVVFDIGANIGIFGVLSGRGDSRCIPSHSIGIHARK